MSKIYSNSWKEIFKTTYGAPKQIETQFSILKNKYSELVIYLGRKDSRGKGNVEKDVEGKKIFVKTGQKGRIIKN